MINILIKFFVLCIVNLGIVLKSENVEFILSSADTLKGFEFLKIEENNLILESSNINYILDIKDLNSIDKLSYRLIKPSKNKIIYNTTVGFFLGYITGNLMGNVLIWWIKNKKLGSLNLFESNPNDLDEGERYIRSTAIKFMTSLGFYAGYNLNNEKLILRKKYELVNMTMDQKKSMINKMFSFTEKENFLFLKFYNKLKYRKNDK